MSIGERTYNDVMSLYGYSCAECRASQNVEMHHKLPKSKSRIKLYPLFIHSPMNLIPLCGGLSNNCHLKFKNKHRIGENEAQIYENYLQSLKEER